MARLQWITDRETGMFYGTAFIEMANASGAATAVARSGLEILSRPAKARRWSTFSFVFLFFFSAVVGLGVTPTSWSASSFFL